MLPLLVHTIEIEHCPWKEDILKWNACLPSPKRVWSVASHWWRCSPWSVASKSNMNGCFLSCLDGSKQAFQNKTRQGTNISHLWKTKIILKKCFGRGYMLFARRVLNIRQLHLKNEVCWGWVCHNSGRCFGVFDRSGSFTPLQFEVWGCLVCGGGKQCLAIKYLAGKHVR